MLEPLRDILRDKTIVLAGKSPSRREALKNIGLDVLWVKAGVDETLDREAHTPEKYVEILALRKVKAVEDRLLKEGLNAKTEKNSNKHMMKADLIIGADTVVTLDGKIFTKPDNETEAFQTLRSLSGRENVVYTGVCMKKPGRDPVVFSEKTSVFFGEMTDEQIKGYIATGEPMKVAGSFAIQGRGGTFIQRINGNYFNVLGLPVHTLCKKMYEIFRN